MTIKVGDTLPAATFMTTSSEGPKPITGDEAFKGTVALFAVPAPSPRPARPSTCRASRRRPPT